MRKKQIDAGIIAAHRRGCEAKSDPGPTQTFLYFERGTSEWDAAWGALRSALVASSLGNGDDVSQTEPDTLESWQYMGSRHVGSMFFHDFRHRRHPNTKRREYLQGTSPATPLRDDPNAEIEF